MTDKEKEDMRVNEICRNINEFLVSKQFNMRDGLTALVVILISQCIQAKICKAYMMNYIANSWEATQNDLDKEEEYEIDRFMDSD